MNIEKFTATSKKTGKEFTALKLTIGDWSTLIFPKSQFELNYILKEMEKYED